MDEYFYETEATSMLESGLSTQDVASVLVWNFNLSYLEAYEIAEHITLGDLYE